MAGATFAVAGTIAVDGTIALDAGVLSRTSGGVTSNGQSDNIPVVQWTKPL
jgi:hypothetical protein